MKQIAPLAEYPVFIVTFYTEALLEMYPANTFA
jgi:hypothetical protein